jgi:hypothetical protein
MGLKTLPVVIMKWKHALPGASSMPRKNPRPRNAATIAARQMNAQQRLVDYIVDTCGVDVDSARALAGALLEHKLVKLDATMGQFSAKHGSILERDTLLRALGNMRKNPTPTASRSIIKHVDAEGRVRGV